MKGARPLTPDEIAAVSQSFLGKYAVRDKCLFLLGINIGARVSELTALRVGDVWHHSRPVDVLTLRKQTVKGKKESYSIPLNATVKAAKSNARLRLSVIAEMIQWKKAQGENIFPSDFLFASRKGGGRLSRVQVHRILKAAFERAFLTGNVTTHSMRKTVANAVYSATGDLFVVKEILGHKNVSTTQQYLGVGIDKLQEAMDALSEGLGMELDNPKRLWIRLFIGLWAFYWLPFNFETQTRRDMLKHGVVKEVQETGFKKVTKESKYQGVFQVVQGVK
ncbi:tyrosine-type recombinase/integrase [bacterium]|nr:tyrosine-type recombinase/integrase [bacterium]